MATSPPIEYDLCVVGAGVAGLNALHSATRYLGPSDRVALADLRDGPGGMWRDTYPYVRLHQPHPMFTVGDIPWAWTQPPHHLASRDEVQAHFAHCLSELDKRVSLDTRFGHRYLEHREHPDHVEVAFERVQDGARVEIRAKRLVKASSYDIQPAPPLALSSGRVRSISPHDLPRDAVRLEDGDEPVVVVGGGKTAMDTAHYLIKRFPGRDVRMLIGDGVLFLNRDVLYPRGRKRWTQGTLANDGFLLMALNYDGTDSDRPYEALRELDALALNERPRQFQFGTLSPAEVDVIRGGLAEVIEDRLVDVVDNGDKTEMLLRDGGREPVEPGTWFVNCTGYIIPGDQGAEFEPYVSVGGRVVSINKTSVVFFLGSFAGYFLTHLLYRDKLGTVPLYQMRGDQLIRADKRTFGAAGASQAVLNQLLLTKALPLKVFKECRLDFNQWYPLPRQLPSIARMTVHSRRYQAHCRAALDELGRRTGVPIGPLDHVQERSRAAAAVG